MCRLQVLSLFSHEQMKWLGWTFERLAFSSFSALGALRACCRSSDCLVCNLKFEPALLVFRVGVDGMPTIAGEKPGMRSVAVFNLDVQIWVPIGVVKTLFGIGLKSSASPQTSSHLGKESPKT